jgi:hypothetical protein
MIRILQLLLLAFILLVVGAVAAFHFLSWWQALIVVFGIIFAITVALRYLIHRVGKMIGGALTKALEIHALVLRGAEVEVHEVLPVEQPAPPAKTPGEAHVDAEDEDQPPAKTISGPRAFYQIDVTIRPANPAVDPEKPWEPTDLRLVPADADVEPLKAADVLKKTVLDKGFPALNIQIQKNGTYDAANIGDKFDGPRRLRLLVALPTDLREVKFRYLTELFGRISLPANPFALTASMAQTAQGDTAG